MKEKRGLPLLIGRYDGYDVKNMKCDDLKLFLQARGVINLMGAISTILRKIGLI